MGKGLSYTTQKGTTEEGLGFRPCGVPTDISDALEPSCLPRAHLAQCLAMIIDRVRIIGDYDSGLFFVLIQESLYGYSMYGTSDRSE